MKERYVEYIHAQFRIRDAISADVFVLFIIVLADMYLYGLDEVFHEPRQR